MNKTGLAIALAAAVVAGSAFAGQAPQLMGDQNSDHSGWYVGALAGYGKTSNHDQTGSNSKLWSWAAGLNGGYQFNQYIAAEVGGLYFGNVTLGDYSFLGETFKAKAKNNYALYAAAKGMLPINSQFDLFAKAGIAAVHTKVTISGVDVSAEGSQTNAALMLGLGGEYYFTQNISVSLEGMYFSKNTSNEGTPQHLVGLAGVAYHF